MFDAIEIIKGKLDMPMVLHRYGFGYSRRMRCPLHDGQDLNFEVKENSWRCYSHCGSGDVISFVQKLFNLSFPETLKKIDADFAFGIYKKPTLKQYRNLQKLDCELKKKKAEKQAKTALLNTEWDLLCERKRLYENVIEFWAPQTPNEEPIQLYVEATQNLGYVNYLLDYFWESEVVKCAK